MSRIRFWWTGLEQGWIWTGMNAHVVAADPDKAEAQKLHWTEQIDALQLALRFNVLDALQHVGLYARLGG